MTAPRHPSVEEHRNIVLRTSADVMENAAKQVEVLEEEWPEYGDDVRRFVRFTERVSAAASTRGPQVQGAQAMKAPTPPHGTPQRYWHGCRCDRCRKAVAKYNYANAVARVEGPAGIAFRADLSDPRHGTANGYSNWKCRCDPCRKAWRQAHRPHSIAYRRRQGMTPWDQYVETVRKPHGTRGKYVKGCRCEKCTRAAAAYQADYRKRKKEQAA